MSTAATTGRPRILRLGEALEAEAVRGSKLKACPTALCKTSWRDEVLALDHFKELMDVDLGPLRLLSQSYTSPSG